MKKFTILCAVLAFGALIGSVGSVSVATANGITIEQGVVLLPDAHPLFGDSVGVRVDVGGIVGDWDRIKATLLTVLNDPGSGVKVDSVMLRQSPDPNDDPDFWVSERPLATLGDMPRKCRVDVDVIDTVGVGPADDVVVDSFFDVFFETTNLRIEDDLGHFRQIFEPGDVVHFQFRADIGNVSIHFNDIYNMRSPINPISLVRNGDLEATYDTGVLPDPPMDYEVTLFDNTLEQPLPVDGIIPQFTTDPIQLAVGTVPSATNKDVLVPVFIGTPNDSITTVGGVRVPKDNVVGKDILATSLDIAFDDMALNFEGVVLLDGVAEQSDHRVVSNLDGESHLIKIRTAGAGELLHEGPLFYLKFHVDNIPNDGLAEIKIDHEVLETKEGNFLFAAPVIHGGIIPLIGDVNRSGEITAFDGIIILKFLVGRFDDVYPFNPANNPLDHIIADANKDGRVSAIDAAFDFFFDANGHFPGEVVKLVPFSTNRTLEVAAIQRAGDHLLVPVRLSELSGVMAGEMTLAYDPASFEVVNVTTLSNWNVASNAQDGKLKVAFAGTTAGAGAGDVLNIELRPLSGLNIAGSPLTITEAILNDQIIKVAGVEGQSGIPKTYALLQNNPNPFNPETQIRYELPASGHVTLVVYNLTGQVVRSLVNAQQTAGRYTVTWDGKDDRGQAVATGLYVYRLTAGTFTATKKMVMMK